ncbi:MAG: hypothetical protein HY962_00560 [Ignavibacteriae bacterium]|nr:hypothetical protein [Ignavibacteriota bacterium]
MRILSLTVLALLVSVGALRAQGVSSDDDPKRDQKSGASQSTETKSASPSPDDDELKKQVEELRSQLQGMDEAVKELQTDRDALKKIKVSGYLQVNFEKSELEKGLATDPYDGKDFIKSRFRLRRSRIKFQYDGGLTNMVVQADYSNTGFSLKDAYLEFTEPWMKYFALRLGVFNRPNYEVEYSSSQRESPERSRIISTLYPGERDLGAMLTFSPEDLFSLQIAGFNNTFGGTFNQANPNFGTEPYYFMARATKSFTLGDLGLDVGVHGRFGNVRANSAKVLESDVPTNGVADSTLKVGDPVSRNWFGVEAQLYYDFFGGMKILGEYIVGSDVNTLSTAAPINPIRKRDFSGFYVMLVKNIGDEFQIAVKYDSYNPNTAISEDKVNLVNELTVSTLGLGIHNYTFPNVRLTLWYDMPSTKTNDRFLKTDPVDNLMTFRAQYKF